MTHLETSSKSMGADSPSAELALTREFTPFHFAGLAALKRVVDDHRDTLRSNGGDGNQHVAFDHVSQEAFGKIEEKRLELLMKARISYFPDIETLVVKIPTMPHEKAHGQLGQLVLLKTVAPMNLQLSDFASLGARTVRVQNGSTKEGDSSWTNANSRGPADFPCIVVESDMSESLNRLRSDARWWIENSAGRVNIVVIIWVRKASRILHIEKYVPGFPKTRTSPRLARPVAANLTATIVIDSTTWPSTVTRAPLVLEFSGLFDRPPNPPWERCCTHLEDLQYFGDMFWVGT